LRQMHVAFAELAVEAASGSIDSHGGAAFDAVAIAAMKKPEISLKVALGLGKGRDRVPTCDLTKDYVAINGDYRS
jgi:N-acetylglutamate synthase/N-acetylornithine aminotransferase